MVRLALFTLILTTAAHAQLELSIAKPTRGSVTRYVTLPGNVKPLEQATLFAKVTGYVKSIAVDKGDAVKAGDLIAELEAPEVLAELAKCEAELASKQPRFQFAKQELDRLTKAQKTSPDLVLPQMIEKAQADHDAAKAEFDVVEASAAKARALIAFTKITAPISGIVTARFVDVGAFVPAATAGSPTNASIVTVMNFSSVRAQVGVPEVDTSFVAKGQNVLLTVEGLAGKEFKGSVTRFAYALDPTTRTMLVESELKNDSLELRPGMYGTIKVGVQTHDNALLIPTTGLVMEKAAAFAFTFADGKAKKNPITIGFNDGKQVEILTGIDETAQVLLPDKATLTPDQPVKIKP
jgi:RND family efflux transporter MFP subunit